MATLDISFKPERAHLHKPKRGVMTKRVVPQSVSGRYRRLKWIALIACLAVGLAVNRWAFGRKAVLGLTLAPERRPAAAL